MKKEVGGASFLLPPETVQSDTGPLAGIYCCRMLYSECIVNQMYSGFLCLSLSLSLYSSGRQISSLRGHTATVNSVSSCSWAIVSGSDDRSLRLWNFHAYHPS